MEQRACHSGCSFTPDAMKERWEIFEEEPGLWSLIWRVAKSLTAGRGTMITEALADDVIDAVARYAQRLEKKGRKIREPKGVIWTIARRRLKKVLKRRREHKPLEETNLCCSCSSEAEELLVRRDERERFAQAMALLSADEQQILRAWLASELNDVRASSLYDPPMPRSTFADRRKRCIAKLEAVVAGRSTRI